ncbi:hypothetical protein PC128_g16046 [Phytophthora cactorum]|nr:hypothetical protein PC128_g16046 [Phytophthora cactorum]
MDHNYNLLRPHCFDFSAITEATTDEIKAASWTMDVGLLEKTMLCPHTRIHSDKFATYVAKRGSRVDTLANNRMFADMHYEHSWENHTLNFVDPLTGTHANTIEGLWEMQIKRHIKAMRGMSKDYLDGYVDEYMWRSWFCSVRASPGEYMCVLVQTVIRYPKDDK